MLSVIIPFSSAHEFGVRGVQLEMVKLIEVNSTSVQFEFSALKGLSNLCFFCFSIILILHVLSFCTSCR